MKKHIFAKFYALILLFAACPLLAGMPDNIELSAKLNLFWAQADSDFLNNRKQNSAKLGLDFKYHINENLNFVFLPYAQSSYNVSWEGKTQTKARIWQSYLDYNLADFKFNFGRFDFANAHLAPFIYYGEDLPQDLARPTSLDGIKHSFAHKYFSYTLLAAKEAQIIDKTRAKLAGAEITVTPFTWLHLSGFYFYQNKKYPRNYNKINSKLSLFGGGMEIFLSKTSGLRFYVAQNSGEQLTTNSLITWRKPYEGYAFNAEIYYQTLYENGIIENKLGLYSFSKNDRFYNFPNKMNIGIIYGGMNYNNVLLATPQIVYILFDFKPKKYNFLDAGAGVFLYSGGNKEFNNSTYNATEINLNAGVKFETWGLKLTGGFFKGEAAILGTTTSEKQSIKKLQANFFYKFSL